MQPNLYWPTEQTSLFENSIAIQNNFLNDDRTCLETVNLLSRFAAKPISAYWSNQFVLKFNCNSKQFSDNFHCLVLNMILKTMWPVDRFFHGNWFEGDLLDGIVILLKDATEHTRFNQRTSLVRLENKEAINHTMTYRISTITTQR